MTPAEAPALVVTAADAAAVQSRPVPAPGPGQVLVATEFSGVSTGTELWAASGKHGGWGVPPFVPGYQATGRVAAVGTDAADSLAVGDLVACFAKHSHQRYFLADAQLAHPVEANEHLPATSLFVQAAVAANALNHAGVKTGDSVLVVGQGLIGQATAQLARLRGAYVIGTDVAPTRLAIAKAHCADRVVDASLGPASEQIADQFPDGVDVVLESTGFTALVDDAMRCARRDGTFVFEGYYPDGLAFEFPVPHVKQLRAAFPCFIGDRACREGVLRLLTSGTLDLRPLISDLDSWRDADRTYARLFTPARDSLNGIVFDWRDAR